MKQAYPCQNALIAKSVESLQKVGAFLNSSDTGVGKTLMSVMACKEMGLPGLVICPLAVVPAWKKTFEEQGVPFVDVVGWEKARTGKTKHGMWVGRKFVWRAKNCTLIFDECHKAKTRGTKNSRMMMGARDAGLPRLMLSATVGGDPSELGALGYCLHLHSDVNYVQWALDHGCEFDFWGTLRMTTCESLANAHLAKLNAQIYPSRGGRLTRADMAEHFTECSINADPMDFGPEIASIFEEEMGDELQIVDGKVKADIERAREKARAAALKQGASDEEADQAAADADVNALTRILRMRQRVELAKCVEILNLLTDYRAEGYSVAVFLNFDASIEALRERIKEPCSIIRGGQKASERAIEVENFQRNAHRIILCNIAAGGVGISLHDEHGGHPRASIISPSYNEKEYHQVLGRIDRAGTKTASLQRVLVAEGTVEERIIEAITCKLRNLSALHQVDPVPPSPTIMQPAEEPVLEFTEDNPCGTVVTVPVAKQAVVPVKKPRKTKTQVLVGAEWVDPNPAFQKTIDSIMEGLGVRPLPAAEEPPAHAKYGPSSLKMYEVAPMYQPTKGSGPAAEMGTRIHLACETGNLDALVDEERLIAEKMLNGVDMIVQRHKLDLTKCEDHKEIRLTMVTESTIWQDEYDAVTGEKIGGGWKVIETFGTCDRLFISGSVGVMIDYKTGRNSVEDPEINAQTQAYVAGAFQKFPQLQTITFYFLLPVRDEVSYATYTRDQLPKLLLRIATIIKRAMTATTCNPQPGICDFCALADGRCQQLNQFALPIAVKYQQEGYPIPENVHASENSDPVNLARLLQLARIMEKWSSAVKYRCQQAVVEDGLELPGFNLIRTKGRSSVLSTVGAYNVLRDDLSIEDFLACSDLSLSKLEDFVSAKAARGEKGAAAAAIKGKLIDADVIAESEGSYQLRVKKS